MAHFLQIARLSPQLQAIFRKARRKTNLTRTLMPVDKATTDRPSFGPKRAV